MYDKIRLFLILGGVLSISACGVGGVNVDDCDNPPPSRVAECEAKAKGAESSTWDTMKWNDDTWG